MLFSLSLYDLFHFLRMPFFRVFFFCVCFFFVVVFFRSVNSFCSYFLYFYVSSFVIKFQYREIL